LRRDKLMKRPVQGCIASMTNWVGSSQMPGSRLKIVFFDAMGTVISLKAWVVAMMNEFARISKKYGIAFEDLSGAWSTEWRKANEDIRNDKTKPFRSIRELFHDTFMKVGQRIGAKLQEQDVADSVERVYGYVNEHAEAFPDVPKTLTALRGEGYQVGIISDADSEDLSLQLKSAGIITYFDTMTTSSEVMSYKPDTKIFEVALAKTKCKPSQACYIGDTPEFDICGANRVGLHSILVTHGRTKINMKSFKPAHTIKEIGDVIPLLHELST
jgi:2-haloalkanoic acid dehalogenase type II